MDKILETAAALVISLGGSSAIILALSNWLGKVWAKRMMIDEKAKHDKELEKLRSELKHDVEKKTYIHRLQFEKEFQCYQSLWKKLVILSNAIRALRPILGTRLKGETEENQKKRLSAEAGDALVDFLKEKDNNRPFYPEDIYAKLNELVNVCLREAIEYQYGDHKIDIAYWDKAAKNTKEMLDLIDGVSLRIRERISNVEIA